MVRFMGTMKSKVRSGLYYTVCIEWYGPVPSLRALFLPVLARGSTGAILLGVRRTHGFGKVAKMHTVALPNTSGGCFGRYLTRMNSQEEKRASASET